MFQKIFFCLIAVAFAFSFDAYATDPIPDDKREQYREKFRQYQHQVITRELELSRDEANQFFPVYDKMCDELERIGRETRQLVDRVLNNAEASDTECEAAARALYQQKIDEADIQMKYFEQMKDLLSPRQLLGLQDAERVFRMEVINFFASQQKK